MPCVTFYPSASLGLITLVFIVILIITLLIAIIVTGYTFL